MNKGKWVSSFLCVGLMVWQQVGSQAIFDFKNIPIVSENETISFDRLYPRHSLDDIQYQCALLWHEIKELVDHLECRVKACGDSRRSILNMHAFVQHHLKNIGTDERRYVAAIMTQIESRLNQAHEKNKTCCFYNLAWMLEGVRAEIEVP